MAGVLGSVPAGCTFLVDIFVSYIIASDANIANFVCVCVLFLKSPIDLNREKFVPVHVFLLRVCSLACCHCDLVALAVTLPPRRFQGSTTMLPSHRDGSQVNIIHPFHHLAESSLNPDSSVNSFMVDSCL